MIGRPGKYTIRKKKTPTEDTSGDQLPDPHSVGLELSPEFAPGTQTPGVDSAHLDTARAGTAIADVAASDPLAASECEDLIEPSDFSLPAIPIAPTKPIDSPISRVLSSGDALIDLARDPIPDGPNPAIFRPRTASVRSDRLTGALGTGAFAPNETHTSAESSESDSAHNPDFPFTPFAPFITLPHPDDIALDGTVPAGTEEANNGHEPASTDPPVAPQQVLTAPTDIALQDAYRADTPLTIAPPTFYPEPEPESRIPNFGHASILVVIALLGFVAAGLAVQFAFRAHLWGVKTIEQAATDVHYTLASMAVLYIVSFSLSFFFFPRLWHKPFFAALQWNAHAAVRYRRWLFAAACLCFVLALIDELILPGPNNAPIDKMFSNTSAAWLLFGFGVLVAPFFEEMTFRGFLLPALCTSVDWAVSLRTKQPPPPLGPNGHPQWSLAAMIIGSLLTSLPFAAMHADQIAHSIGPLLLLYCVSLVLCFARLITRSLAASTFVHASYNFLLFSLMLVGTGGFRHLDKM
jgi:membrane protease YdiL (CAAX protease family)